MVVIFNKSHAFMYNVMPNGGQGGMKEILMRTFSKNQMRVLLLFVSVVCAVSAGAQNDGKRTSGPWKSVSVAMEQLP